MGIGGVLRAGLGGAVLLSSLSLVTWRQSRAFEVLERVDDLHGQISIAEAERVDLQHTIQTLESRAWIVPEARKRLGMHTPDASELVILPEEGVR